MEAIDAKKSDGLSGHEIQSFFSRRRRLLGAVAGMVASLALAATLVRSELYALPGGVGFAFRHEMATEVRLQIRKVKRRFYDPSRP